MERVDPEIFPPMQDAELDDVENALCEETVHNPLVSRHALSRLMTTVRALKAERDELRTALEYIANAEQDYSATHVDKLTGAARAAR